MPTMHEARSMRISCLHLGIGYKIVRILTVLADNACLLRSFGLQRKQTVRNAMSSSNLIEIVARRAMHVSFRAEETKLTPNRHRRIGRNVKTDEKSKTPKAGAIGNRKTHLPNESKEDDMRRMDDGGCGEGGARVCKEAEVGQGRRFLRGLRRARRGMQGDDGKVLRVDRRGGDERRRGGGNVSIQALECSIFFHVGTGYRVGLG
ncbi:uncharacterized protein J3R85_006244 [Psidium guajava]|nr:uncharacterized protein J3R85_006244 [Psidium guajava]